MTATRNKARGREFETEVVKLAEARGHPARRAWGSDGRALGLSADVDLTISGIPVQAKRRKRLPAYLQIPDSCKAVVFKQDRSPPLILITLDDYLCLLTNSKA